MEFNNEDKEMAACIIRHIEEELKDLQNDKCGHQEIVSDMKESCRERISWLENLLKRAEQEDEAKANTRIIDIETYNKLKAIGILDTSVRAYNRGTITLGHDDDADPHPGQAPEEELTDEEKRIRRMAEEYDQLTERYGKLRDFLASDKCQLLSETMRTLLFRQHQAMHDYREALRQRIRIDADAANLKVEINDPDDE